MDDLATLERLSRDLGVALDKTALARFQDFRSLLLEWNQHTNLTRVTDPQEIELKLFLDALQILPWVERQGRQAGRARPAQVVDVGAGAGFPGIPLKIADPSMELVLIEATGKKARFIETAVARLALDGVRVIHGRSEDLARQAGLRGAFDIVVARAVARLPALLELCLPFCRPGGWGIFPKGREAEVEAQESARALRLLKARLIGVEPAQIPELTGSSLVIVEQRQPAPQVYPRRVGVPGKTPL